METINSTISCIWHYDATIYICHVIVKLCFYTISIAADTGDDVFELHIFRDLVGVILKAEIAMLLFPSILKIYTVNAI